MVWVVRLALFCCCVLIALCCVLCVVSYLCWSDDPDTWNMPFVIVLVVRLVVWYVCLRSARRTMLNIVGIFVGILSEFL